VLAKQRLDVRFIVNHENEEVHLGPFDWAPKKSIVSFGASGGIVIPADTTRTPVW
jgi:hypothetical protein